MADIAFGSVEKVIKLALKVQKQVETVRHNEDECRDIEQDVGILIGILSLLQQKPEVISHPAINGALLGLERSLGRALKLVTDCQSKSLVRRFFGAGDMSKQLRVHNDIKWKLDMGTFATNLLQLELTITLTNTIHYRDAHPAAELTQPQAAGGAEISYTSHLTTDDARSGVDSEITMGSEVSFPPSSRLTMINSSESEATMHHFSEENISGGGHSFVLKQKIVIKVSVSCDRSLRRAEKLAASRAGVYSVITGDGRDQLEVVGDGIDTVRLVRLLRKKIGLADLIKVEKVKEKKYEEPIEEEQEWIGDGMPGGLASAAARQHGGSSEGTGQIIENLSNKKPAEPKLGARKSKKGWAIPSPPVLWRQLWRGNKAGAKAAAKGQGGGSSRLHQQDCEDEE